MPVGKLEEEYESDFDREVKKMMGSKKRSE
jgi:hypothetical protein